MYDTYLKLLAAHGIDRTISRAGNCYDNASIESFWSTVKSEADLDVIVSITRSAADLAIFDYIETFYNRVRRHTSLGSMSPMAFENQQN